MEFFIDFLVNNYIWFLVISIILLFSLIGFLVESSKVNKSEDPKVKEKPKKENKKEKKKKEKKEAILEDSTPTIEELIKQQEQAEDISETKNKEALNDLNKSETEYDEPLMVEENIEESKK